MQAALPSKSSAVALREANIAQPPPRQKSSICPAQVSIYLALFFVPWDALVRSELLHSNRSLTKRSISFSQSNPRSTFGIEMPNVGSIARGCAYGKCKYGTRGRACCAAPLLSN